MALLANCVAGPGCGTGAWAITWLGSTGANGVLFNPAFCTCDVCAGGVTGATGGVTGATGGVTGATGGVIAGAGGVIAGAGGVIAGGPPTGNW